jgi:transcriptional regulator with XRE-family HTH domain
MLGDVLRNLRESRRLTPKDLATKVGITYSALGKYERNEREPDYTTLVTLADYFGVSIDFLLDRKNIIAVDQKKAELGNEITRLLVNKGFIIDERGLSNDIVYWVINLLEKALDIANIKT